MYNQHMFTIERLRTDVLALPLLARVGIVLLIVGGVADVVAHVVAGGAVEPVDGHTVFEALAHLVRFAGMAITLLGVVAAGVRRSRLGRPADGPSTGGM